MNPTCACTHKTTCWLGDVCHGRNHNADARPDCWRELEPESGIIPPKVIDLELFPEAL